MYETQRMPRPSHCPVYDHLHCEQSNTAIGEVRPTFVAREVILQNYPYDLPSFFFMVLTFTLHYRGKV